ncbi:MAG: selenocysteine protein [Candidatus Omnitrophota bacterium]|nr:MAG: selenocysteine protein [Candidatus Omnitrophota bacterium]
MGDLIIHNLKHTGMITVFVFIMMIFTDYLNVLTKGRMAQMIKKGTFRQYVMSSFLGATPGCLGSFMNVSFYVHGLISFGAIVGGMIATSGDEAFVMLAMFPRKALMLFAILFVLGVISGYITDKLSPFLKTKLCKVCKFSDLHLEECRCLDFKGMIEGLKKMSLVRFLFLFLLFIFLYGFISGVIGPSEWDWKRITFVSLLGLATFIVITVPDHYLEEHIYAHIFKKHIWRVFLWSFTALILIDLAFHLWDLKTFVNQHLIWVLLISGFVGLIPESGPNLVFVIMFAKGVIPFSVLLTNSIVQDGHGILPLLSYTIKDAMLIKLVNLFIGLAVGGFLYLLGF